MSLETLAVALFALVIGGLWAFFGFKFFLILLPIWGFFTGFFLGAHGMTTIFGEGFLATVTGWVVGFVLGLVFAVLSYLYYYIAVLLLGGTLGYLAGVGVMEAIGIEPGFLTLVVGVVAGVALAIVTAVLRAPKYLVIVLSALGGSAAVVAGVLLLLGTVELQEFRHGVMGAAWTAIVTTPIWLVVWAVIAAAGMIYQVRTTQLVTEIDTSGYRYQTTPM
jgi:hypothetical protein